MDTGIWNDDEADIIVSTDMALCINLAFVYPSNGLVYSIMPPNIPIDIFFLELLAILFVIHFVASFEASKPFASSD